MNIVDDTFEGCEDINPRFPFCKKHIRVKFIGQDDPLALRHGKVYDAIVGQKGMLGIVDETGEEYVYPPDLFEIVLSDEQQ